MQQEFTKKAQTALNLAARTAKQLGQTYIGTEHLLLGLIREGEGVAAKVLENLGVELNKCRSNVIKMLGETKTSSSGSSSSSGGSSLATPGASAKNAKTPSLDEFGTDLTLAAQEQRLDPVVGREKEVERVIQILARRTKNNPVLIGEPGVGKTAIANGLALKIVNKDVPAKLLKCELYLLDLTALVSGTQFRGQFEARIKGIVDECKEYGNIILVIDEIHNIVGAGNAENAMNAGNILKPALSNGSIQVIGTTTLNEYRKHIEKDSALERRFQPVIIDEPDIKAATEILKGIKQYYEQYHNIHISDEILEKIVVMSEKYIHDRFLPDKAIDILDEACSKVNLHDKELAKLEIFKQRLAEIQAKKDDAVQNDSIEDYQKAAQLKTEECNVLESIEKIEKVVKA